MRIKIECAFGMLVARWGVLRRPLPSRMGMRKIVRLVVCLCRLHNYCINRCMKETGVEEPAPEALAADALEIMGAGGVPLERREGQGQENTKEGGVRRGAWRC